MRKPGTIDGYDENLTADCERLLVTLLRGLGPWKESVCLIGGLVPRYLVTSRPPDVPPHAGTQDVDIVIDLQILADTEAYHTLEGNLRRMGFERWRNEAGTPLSWRWQVRTESGAAMILELLADAPDIAGGRVQVLPTTGTISALNIPHASIVFDLHETREIRAELLAGGGFVTETVRHADVVSFTCLKVIAFSQRAERKDAHDLVYCIEHAPDGLDGVAARFRTALTGPHGAVVGSALALLKKHFLDEADVEGYLKDGPVATARFEFDDRMDDDVREPLALRQRQVNGLISDLISLIDGDYDGLP